MVKYSDVEEKIRQKFLQLYQDELTDNSCVVSDIDKLLNEMLEKDLRYGVILEYSGASLQRREPFNGAVWVWRTGGIFFVRYSGDQAETDRVVRDIIDKMPTLFDNDRRLGGLVSLVSLTTIDEPEPGLLNDVPFYALYFGVESLVKD